MPLKKIFKIASHSYHHGLTLIYSKNFYIFHEDTVLFVQIKSHLTLLTKGIQVGIFLDIKDDIKYLIFMFHNLFVTF